MNAHAVNQGELPVLTATDRDFFFLRRRDPAAAVKTIQELCQTRLPKNMGIQPSDIQVLTPTRKYGTGMAALNVRLQAALNPPSPEKKERRFGETVFREGDRVMQIRNDHDIVLKNPDVVLCIGRAGPMLLTRSVLYTAITRAKSLLIIVGDEGAAYHMIDNQTQTRRYSGLRARLCGECGAI